MHPERGLRLSQNFSHVTPLFLQLAATKCPTFQMKVSILYVGMIVTDRYRTMFCEVGPIFGTMRQWDPTFQILDASMHCSIKPISNYLINLLFYTLI